MCVVAANVSTPFAIEINFGVSFLQNLKDESEKKPIVGITGIQKTDRR